MLRRLLSALGIDLFGRAKLLVAFEYGLQVAEVAKENGRELDAELVEKAEDMLLGEARTQSATHMSTNAVPNLLSAFELDMSE